MTGTRGGGSGHGGAAGTLARPCRGAGTPQGVRGRAPGLTSGEHGRFTPNLLQLWSEQGIHLPLQGPRLPAGALGPAGDHLGAARAAGVRGRGAAAARTLPPGPRALGGPSASPWGCQGGPQQVCLGTGLLADGRVPAFRPRAGRPAPLQALGVLAGAGAHHALHAGGGHLGRPRALGGTREPPLHRAPVHRRLTSGAAASRPLLGQGLRSGARAGGCHGTGLPLGAHVLHAQGQLREGLAAWLLALGRGAGRAPQEPLANGGPGRGPPSSMTVQGAGL